MLESIIHWGKVQWTNSIFKEKKVFPSADSIQANLVDARLRSNATVRIVSWGHAEYAHHYYVILLYTFYITTINSPNSIYIPNP